jgi:hypothetical protein
MLAAALKAKADSLEGNDRKKSKGRNRSFAALRMTTLCFG